MFVYLPGRAAKLAFAVPQDSCCNCGATQKLSIVETPLKKTRYMVLGGTELRFTLELPYCTSCARTASRFPTGLFTKLLVAFGVFWALLLAAILALPKLGTWLPGPNLPVAAAIAALVLTFGFYALRRAHPPQTSYSQPVTLKGLKQKFSGEIVGMALRFSNPAYASQFSLLNEQFVASGALTLHA